ncbi:TRI39 ligase, partial [Alectura lathami]|nr:TRI39 ligase [Alectura lathami]
DITLDADTAHPTLQVSEDGKSVTDIGVIRKVPSKKERFDFHTFVLAKEGYTSGRLYWEVDVGKKRHWNLGVAQETVRRKETVALLPKNGFWVIGLVDEREYWAYSDPWTRLTVSGRPQRIGIFLDVSSKKLSFFNVHEKKLLYIFNLVNHHSQEVRLFPFFSTGLAVNKADTEPLRIAQAFDDDDE